MRFGQKDRINLWFKLDLIDLVMYKKKKKKLGYEMKRIIF